MTDIELVRLGASKEEHDEERLFTDPPSDEPIEPVPLKPPTKLWTRYFDPVVLPIQRWFDKLESWCETPEGKRITVLGAWAIFILTWVIIFIVSIAHSFDRIISFIGMLVFVGISAGLSVHRKHINWRPVMWGLWLQIVFAALVLKTDTGYSIFEKMADGVENFLLFSEEGSKFVFGDKYVDHPFPFKILPTIMYFGAFINMMYFLGVIQFVLKIFTKFVMLSMGTSGAESLSAVSNIFIGQSEAPLLIRPYLKTLTSSELHCVMTGGFATIAGGVMAAYISFGVSSVHLIAASLISCPAAIAISKLMYPETQVPLTRGTVNVNPERPWANLVEAVGEGAITGMKLVWNIVAVILVFVSLVAACNGFLGWIGSIIHVEQLSFQWLVGYLLLPLAWVMGVPWDDCQQVGQLLGEKIILNEFLAYMHLTDMVKAGTLSRRAEVIATYALCGFSNISSIGVQIGAFDGIAPEKKTEVATIGWRAMLAGNIACFVTATVAGILL